MLHHGFAARILQVGQLTLAATEFKAIIRLLIGIHHCQIGEGDFRQIERTRALDVSWQFFIVVLTGAITLDSNACALCCDVARNNLVVQKRRKRDRDFSRLNEGEFSIVVANAHVLQRDAQTMQQGQPQFPFDGDLHSQRA